MRIRVLGCSGGSAPGREPSCYLLDRGVAVDAGALAARLSLDEQNDLRHVFLTHAHWDHCRDLPMHVTNRRSGTPTLVLHALPQTIAALRAHLFNEAVWFRAFDLPCADAAYVAAEPLDAGATIDCAGYRITARAVPHTVPAAGFLVDDGRASVILAADTGGGGVFDSLPAGASPLRAVFVEASLPNRLKDFAALTGHLTPELLAREIAPLPPDVEVLVTHMKPGFEEEIARELAALGRPRLRPCRDGESLEF
jgi:3',5'-cyclic-nucleotide phosphodiesterase